MIVTRAVFRDFRNVEEETIEFSPTVNVLWGMNAQGKSNILEGIYLFARGRSFRGAHDRDMIRQDASASGLGVSVEREGEKYPVELIAELSREGKKRLLRNGAPLSSVSEMIGNLRAVLFCPAHLSVVNGGPAERRSFLDVAISQLDPGYIRDLSLYRAAYSHRAALLRRFSSGAEVRTEEWEVFSEQMSDAASRIAAARFEYVKKLSLHVASFFEEMTGGAESPSVSYKSHLLGGVEDGYDPAEGKKILFDKLTSNIEREAAAGSTLWGTHKDDIRLALDGSDARLFASQGQQRSFALALKLSEGEISREKSGEYPVFLLDDVFSELDANRRKYITDRLLGRQIIVTSCEPSVIPGGEGAARFIEIKNGSVAGVR
ncbi:MAG: DNA replication/repair protein RecF [Clostridia bacterium]|nr:DNA replication/repair protein RecF [Clostridia bacterium]MBQ6678115.1 DNA replication/repair protein RecF [Clostridia bacterium]